MSIQQISVAFISPQYIPVIYSVLMCIIYLLLCFIGLYIYIYDYYLYIIPVVPHKAVAEVSKIGNL